MKKNNQHIFWEGGGEESHVTSGPSHEIKASTANHHIEEVNLH
jgi:hypothetical protein